MARPGPVRRPEPAEFGVRLVGLVAEAGLDQLGLLTRVIGDSGTAVQGLTMDSRQVGRDSLFACVPGQNRDGHEFAADAVVSGAAAILCERPLDLAAPQVVVTSVRRALGPVADAINDHPSRHLTVAGVTGTNGKTTTCALLQGAFEATGWQTATIGTLTHPRTTPEAPDLHALMASWRQAGGDAITMEVSSHALVQHRVDAVSFAAAVFTNLTPEHLDYHHTMDDYFEAKAMLFTPDRVGLAVVNRADPWGRRLLERLDRLGVPTETFAPGDAADVELAPSRSQFTWAGQRVTINLGGRFNLANAVAAATCARALGIDPADIATGMAAVRGVRGRFEPVDAGQPFTVLIDYAHTPDGLAQALRGARELTPGHLLVVFGAGGDRDHDKRPLMGAAATELADVAVVTSDNPRSEDPDAIIAAIVAGVPPDDHEGRSKLIVEPDRAAAISVALGAARPGDVVLIAGKGHEPGQEIAGETRPFDDAAVARASLQRILTAGAASPPAGRR
jgi:UDP-N-acetylmuramoyl-L-alanyl-D-glutamate--2,6-diaminopimelate ligase